MVRPGRSAPFLLITLALLAASGRAALAGGPPVLLDSQPPDVVVLAPNGGESWGATSVQTVTWIATDNIIVVSVDIFYRGAEGEPWDMIARDLDNTGSFSWIIHNTPSSEAKVRVVAEDLDHNEGADESDGPFTILQQPGGIVGTTLRDFRQAGSQPFQGGFFLGSGNCSACHGYYDSAVEPFYNWRGTMMAQAARDPLFYACLAVAEQDAPSSGDLCLRCHTPTAWMSGRSNPTDGSGLTSGDRDGVNCDTCHRLVDPDYEPGVSPAVDEDILAALNPGDVPDQYANGQYVIDPVENRRGPYSDPVTPHLFLESPFHRAGNLCGTCHDVSNPVFEKVGEGDYLPGPLDAAPGQVNSLVHMPLERTYSEWLNSDYPGGVYAPQFAGNKPDGVVSTCQDCHMRDVEGPGCILEDAPIREDLPLHDLTGGNAWVPGLIAQLYPSEVNAAALEAAAARAVEMLQKAALLDAIIEAEGDSFRVDVTVTNQTGHKLPTGYPEGRRMWLRVAAYDAWGALVYESGGYDEATGVLTEDEDIAVYEAKLGISPDLASALGLDQGPSFHFVLNDSVYKDNRIPPRGFTYASFAAFGGEPKDPDRPGAAPRYADGQYWDAASYALPGETFRVVATLYYQTTSKEYVEFLRDENESDDTGRLLYDLWIGNGRAAPVAMAADTAYAVPSSIPESGGRGSALAFRAGPNPFGWNVDLSLELPRPESVSLEVFDLQGRLLRRIDYGLLGGGAHRLRWDGRDGDGTDAGSGVYWVRLLAGARTDIKRIVRVR